MKNYILLCAGLILLFIGCSYSQTETAETADNTLYELRIYEAEAGKLDDLNRRFRDHTLKLFEKHGMVSLGYWLPINNTENRLFYVLAHKNRAARNASFEAFSSDPEWIEAYEASRVDGPLVSNMESVFMAATDFSPAIVPVISETPALFEFRIYKANPGNLEHLHARFRNHTIGLFSRHGIKHFGYWSPIEVDQGADNTLIYIMYHQDADSRDASFTEFRADEDWLEARAASMKAAGGELAVITDRILMMATDYSPTQ